ncbi:hypothetical protein DSCO28_17640 [Desulfosarcina ovata subsp. sediminis]|uniref:Uncharacterized protein n=1 Tax=Desulfosarcina ovata subsp. sediminis TaxID=885957 RepID=A0A5K7ZG85_9BACT|nr:hypothetical protein [Desulfosarcina ovata]BBO81198.1 hypothetical protein DSCO28_17640 [Desulfosarcina ovata subsp. sediminis]
MEQTAASNHETIYKDKVKPAINMLYFLQAAYNTENCLDGWSDKIQEGVEEAVSDILQMAIDSVYCYHDAVSQILERPDQEQQPEPPEIEKAVKFQIYEAEHLIHRVHSIYGQLFNLAAAIERGQVKEEQAKKILNAKGYALMRVYEGLRKLRIEEAS